MRPESRSARLLQMVAALEDTIVRLERESGGSATPMTRRMKLLQGEILAALHLLEGEVTYVSELPRPIGDAFASGPQGRLRPRAEPQLREDVRDVRPSRSLADAERGGDPFVRFAGPEESQDVELA
jgi:hypothetical protein